MAHGHNSTTVNHSMLRVILEPLEAEVMEILWAHGECSVREVVRKLDRDIAYTTVMTTLDRLHRKDLLSRRRRLRAFLYRPSVTREEWKEQVARALIAKLLAGPEASREVLLTCLLEAVGQDPLLLRDLEKRMRENC
jgi:predicted transcriptional regulator